MAKFRKKPVEINAWQYTQAMANEVRLSKATPPGGFDARVVHEQDESYRTGEIIVPTIDGNKIVKPGEWIITSANNDPFGLYLCADRKFRTTHDPVDEDAKQAFRE